MDWGGGGVRGMGDEKYEQNYSWITSNERDHLGNLGIGDSTLKWIFKTGVERTPHIPDRNHSGLW